MTMGRGRKLMTNVSCVQCGSQTMAGTIEFKIEERVEGKQNIYTYKTGSIEVPVCVKEKCPNYGLLQMGNELMSSCEKDFNAVYKNMDEHT